MHNKVQFYTSLYIAPWSLPRIRSNLLYAGVGISGENTYQIFKKSGQPFQRWAFKKLLIFFFVFLLFLIFFFCTIAKTAIECKRLIVTWSRETVPNRTSGKIELTPPAYSQVTVLLVSSLNFGLLTRGWLWQGWIHGDVKGSNGRFRHRQVSGLAISSIAASLGSPNVHTVDCASFQALRSQHSPSRLVFGLH